MNIQIFGTRKSFDTKKAERYFKERGIRFQMVDLKEKGLSRGELQSVLRAVGGLEALLDPKTKAQEQLTLIRYLSPEDREDKALEHPEVFRTPIVRNGQRATVGYCPEVWREWE